MWGNAGLGVSLGIATRPSLPLARRVAPVPSSPLDRVVVSTTSPPWSSPPRRSPAATSSCVSPQHRVAAVVVAGPSLPSLRRQCPRHSPPLPSPALAAAHRPLARRRRGSRRCVAVSSRRRRPSRSRPSSVRASPPSARSPSPVVLVARPPVATRRLCVVATTPSSVVVVVVVVARCLRRHRRRRPRRQHSRPRVALPLCGRPCGLRRHLRPRRYRRLSSSGRHRRPPPVAAVVVVDPRLYPHPSSCSATLPPASLTWDWDVTRRRRRVVVVLAAALWSSSSGLVLAAAGWQCFDVGAGQGTEHDRTPGPNMRATPALPIPRFCSEHQNNVNQTSAFGPWLLLLRRGLANLTTWRLRWAAAAVPEPTPANRTVPAPSAAAERAH